MSDVRYLMMGGVYSPQGSATVTVKINGVTVGETSVASNPGPGNGYGFKLHPLVPICNWSPDTEYQGSQDIEITADSGVIMFMGIFKQEPSGEFYTNNAPKLIETQLEWPAPHIDRSAIYNVQINGVTQPRPINSDLPETPEDIRGWHYVFDAGATFTCSYNFGPYTA